MEVRFYKDADYSETVKMFLALSSYYLGSLSSSEPEIENNIQFNVLGPDSGVKLILAFEGDVAIGLATISMLYPAPKETGQLFVKELFVLEQYQNSGVGRSIMSFIANYAKMKNCCRLDLTVDSDNTRAIQFYKKLGVLPLDTKLYLRADTNAIDSLAKNT